MILPALLEDGVTVAYNSGRESYIQHIADANGVKLNPIEYKNSKEIVLTKSILGTQTLQSMFGKI